jgi:hypothetical protein
VISKSSRSRLNHYTLDCFPSESLFDRVARAVCEAEALPRKELFEAWEVARRVRRRFRGGRVVDLACGHALLAHIMLLLDGTSPSALAADVTLPPSAAKLSRSLTARWPSLEGRVSLVELPLEKIALEPGDLVVSVHACGLLTDRVLDAAAAARARVAVLPCCHPLGKTDHGGLDGWLAPDMAVDVTRAARLRARGYHVFTAEIPAEITPKNRLLLGEPVDG